MNRSLLAGLAVAALFTSAVARADLAPPPGFVETCTAARQQAAGTECYACSSYHGSVEKCPTLLKPAGFTKACQSRGASVWTEVWCRPAGGPALSPEAQKEVVAPTAEELAAVKPAPPPSAAPTTAPADAPADATAPKAAGPTGCGACSAGGASTLGPAALAALVGIAAAFGLRRRGR